MIKAVLFNDTSNEKHIGSKLVIDNIVKQAMDKNICIIKKFNRKEISNTNTIMLQMLESCDFILINGEGTFHHSPRSADNLLYNFKNKPIVIINSVWEKMYFNNLDIFKNIKAIYVRESMSYDELSKIYDREKIKVVPDMVFSSNFSLLNDECKIGYGDSVLWNLSKSLRSHNCYFPLSSIDSQADYYSYLRWLKSLDLYVTGRFHGVCLAALAGTPFLSFPSNCHKIEGILKDMDCSELLINTFEEIKEKKELAKEKIENVKKYVDESNKKINDMFLTISNFFKKEVK